MNNDVQHNKGVRELTTDKLDTSGPRLPWAGKKVLMQRVEAELSHLWRMSADNVRTSQNINVRTSVLNLVICASDIESAQQASKLMRDLFSTHIARFTLLILSETLPTDVSTWVTLRSFPVVSDLMRHSFEQITILVSGNAVPAAAQIIQPLLKPDLPVYLWWLNDPPQNDLAFTDLVKMSNRIIVDSNTFLDPETGITALSSFIGKKNSYAISDLNWARITPWRELVAQFFDVAAYRPYLTGVHRIEVEYAVAPAKDASEQEAPDPTQAFLLAGWLKTILSWKTTGGLATNLCDSVTGTYVWHVMRPAGALPMHSIGTSTGQTGHLEISEEGKIEVRPRVQSDVAPGSICLVRLVSDIEQKYAIFSLNRGNDANHVFTAVELPEGTRSQRTVQVATNSATIELLHDELEIMGPDELYEATLHEVTELLASQ